MPLPKKISPNPLVSAIVEVRFKSTLKAEEAIGLYYPAFINSFSNVKDKISVGNLPFISGNINNFTAEYVFSNEQYSVSLGNNVISFENIDGYHLWSNYLPFIEANLKLLNSLKIVEKILRVGVRYVSIFENRQSLSEVFDLDFNLNYESFKQKPDYFKTELRRDHVRLLIQLLQNAEVKKEGQEEKKQGVYIDIDASIEMDLPDSLGPQLFELIDSLHLEEKKLFYHLLNKDFLLTLNPEY